MTVPAQGFSGPTYIQTPGNGVATVYSFPFMITAATDLIVGFIVAGVYTAQTTYTVSGIGNVGGGQVTFAVAPPANTLIDLRSLIPETQPTNFSNLGAYYPEATTTALDRAVRQVTDLYRLTYLFGIHGPDTEAVPWNALPNALARANSACVFDANGQPSVGVLVPGTFTQGTWDSFLATSTQLFSAIEPFLSPVLPSEDTLVVNPGIAYGDMRRYGIVPNDPASAVTNGTILKALFKPDHANGPQGTFRFVNTTGADVYYIADFIQIRDGVHLDLCGSTLNFSKTYDSSDDLKGWLMFIRDVTIENGSIVVNYNGSTGTNAGMAMRIGSRSGYPFGTYTNGIFDQDDLFAQNLPAMGNITLRNLRISSNNPSSGSGPAAMILALGGLRNLTTENLYFDGQGVVEYGIYYEFGFASVNGFPSDETKWTSSHATNMLFRNTYCRHLWTGGVDGGGIGIGGAHNCRIDGLVVDHAWGVFRYTPGESLNYRPWAPTDIEGAKRGITICGAVGSNIVGTGLVLGGASASSGGYLASVGVPDPQLRDLMSFDVSACTISANGVGAHISGNFELRASRFDGLSASGQIIISDDVRKYYIHDCEIVNSNGAGIRASFPAQTASLRYKSGIIANCLIAGNASIGINIANSLKTIVENCQIGYKAAYDASGESSQTTGINVSLASNGGSCEARHCLVTTASGTAYVATGSGSNNGICGVVEPKGEVTFSGNWSRNGILSASSTTIGDKTSFVNTTDKWTGRVVNDTSNGRLLIAQGPLVTDAWKVADGSATITPS